MNIFNQSGQIPGGFFSGGIWGGIGRGLQNVSDMMGEQERLKQQKEEFRLREKMVNAQLDQKAKELLEKERQREARNAAADIFEQQGQPTFTVDENAFPQAPMTTNTPDLTGGTAAPPPTPQFDPAATDPKIAAIAALMRAGDDPRKFGLVQTGAGSARNPEAGYATIEEAMAANPGLPIDRYKQNMVTGRWFPEFSRPVNFTANVAQQARADAQAGGASPQQALQAGQGALEASLGGQSAASAAGTVRGQTAEKLGQPVPATQLGTGGPPPTSPSYPTSGRNPSGGSSFLELQTRQEEAKAVGRPLEVSDRSAVVAMTDAHRVAQSLLTEFTPEERAKYAGFIKFPVNQLAQVVKSDPKFARFQTLVHRAKATAFGEGGKQLTPFEASVVFGFVPTGKELSAADFEAKLQESANRASFLINERIKLGKTPRGQLQGVSPSAPSTLPPPPAGWR